MFERTDSLKWIGQESNCNSHNSLLQFVFNLIKKKNLNAINSLNTTQYNVILIINNIKIYIIKIFPDNIPAFHALNYNSQNSKRDSWAHIPERQTARQTADVIKGIETAASNYLSPSVPKYIYKKTFSGIMSWFYRSFRRRSWAGKTTDCTNFCHAVLFDV